VVLNVTCCDDHLGPHVLIPLPPGDMHARIAGREGAAFFEEGEMEMLGGNATYDGPHHRHAHFRSFSATEGVAEKVWVRT
jgi:hypothetical protein